MVRVRSEGGGNTVAKHFDSVVRTRDHLTSAAQDEKGTHIQQQGGHRESSHMHQTHQRILQLHEAQSGNRAVLYSGQHSIYKSLDQLYAM